MGLAWHIHFKKGSRNVYSIHGGLAGGTLGASCTSNYGIKNLNVQRYGSTLPSETICSRYFLPAYLLDKKNITHGKLRSMDNENLYPVSP